MIDETPPTVKFVIGLALGALLATAVVSKCHKLRAGSQYAPCVTHYAYSNATLQPATLKP